MEFWKYLEMFFVNMSLFSNVFPTKFSSNIFGFDFFKQMTDRIQFSKSKLSNLLELSAK